MSNIVTLYLVDMVNPSGYAQVVEEQTVTGGSTNLAKVYTYGLDLISQRVPNTSTNFFGYDGLGSTRLLTDGGGTVVNAFECPNRSPIGMDIGQDWVYRPEFERALRRMFTLSQSASR